MLHKFLALKRYRKVIMIIFFKIGTSKFLPFYIFHTLKDRLKFFSNNL